MKTKSLIALVCTFSLALTLAACSQGGPEVKRVMLDGFSMSVPKHWIENEGTGSISYTPEKSGEGGMIAFFHSETGHGSLSSDDLDRYVNNDVYSYYDKETGNIDAYPYVSSYYETSIDGRVTGKGLSVSFYASRESSVIIDVMSPADKWDGIKPYADALVGSIEIE